MILRDVETYTREQLDEIKLNRLKWVIGWVYDRVPFYRQRFDKIGLKPHHIKTLKDIRLSRELKSLLRIIYKYLVI